MKYIDDFLDYLKVVKKHSDNTIISYHGDILEFSEFVHKNILGIDKAMVEGYLTLLYEKNEKKSTIGRKLTSLRVFYDYLLKNEIVSVNYFSEIKNPKKDKSLPKYVKDDDIDKMFLIPDTNKQYGQRNLVIIRLLYATGVRVSELINIKLKDIDVNDRTIRILGKGSKERVVVFGVNTQSDLKKYLNNGRKQLDIRGNDYLFLNKDGNRLSSRYVRKIIDDIVVKASIKKNISPHMLRHTFATEMLNNGADLVSVKDLLGHESLNTTSIYTHLSDDKIREIYDKTHPRAHSK